MSRKPLFVAVVCLAFTAIVSTALLAQPATRPAKAELAVPAGLVPFKPTLVTLKLANTPVLEALGQVGKQGNVSFNVWPDWAIKEIKDKKVSANFEGTAFWTAVEEIAGQAGLAVGDVDFQNPRQISLRQREAGASPAPASVCGPVIVALDHISYERGLDYAKGQPTRKAEVWFKYLLDPALQSGDFGSVAVLSEMADDKGQSLLLQEAEKEHWTSGSVGHMAGTTFAHLRYAGETGRTCRSLRGSIAGTFVLASDTWEVDAAAAAGQSHLAGQITLTISKCVLTKGKCELAVNIKSTARQESDLAAGAIDAINYSLTGADGSPWERREFGGGGFASNKSYSMQFEPADRGKAESAPAAASPGKLIIRIPTQMSKCQVPFEFRGIPLP